MNEMTWEMMLAEVSRQFDEEAERNRKADLSNLWDEEEAVRFAYRKRDWHKNKGKRRIRDGYKERYV